MNDSKISNTLKELYEECPKGRKYSQYSKLLKEHFSNKSLNEIPIGEVKKEKNKLGELLVIKNTRNINKIPDHDTKPIQYDCLRALKGIGPATENKLKNKGYKSIKELKNHEKWGEKSKNFLNKTNKLDTPITGHYQNFLEERIQGNDWTIFDLYKNHNLEDFIILDIETIGLSKVPLFLIGLAEIKKEKQKVKTTQYLARDFNEEKNILLETRNHIKNRPLITFNGKKFDIPFIKRRALHHNIETNIKENLNIDILKFAKNTWKEELNNCKLKTLEKRYNVERKGDIPSGKVPDYYTQFTRTGNIGTLVPILEHNIQDLVSTAKIFTDLIKKR